MTKTFCDSCGKEVDCHILEIPNFIVEPEKYSSYCRDKKLFEVCDDCYARTFQAAWKALSIAS